MTIRKRLQILAGTTILGLGLILFFTITGLNAMHETETVAQRRESYSLLLVDIKASAISTILLDPTLKESEEIFAEAEKQIRELSEKVLVVKTHRS
jgi:methyl-accepting chemotaxis protein